MLVNFVKNNYRNWSEKNKTIRELSRLNDRELFDIGIDRNDIKKIAKRSIY